MKISQLRLRRWQIKLPPCFLPIDLLKNVSYNDIVLIYENEIKVVAMSSEKTFGSFLKEKRLEKGYTLRGFAGKIDVSPVHMSNMENDRRAAPKEDILERISNLLLLSKEERLEMTDLAAKSKNMPSVSSDLPDYIMENDIVRAALRTAKDVDATDNEWMEFIEKLKKRSSQIKQED